LIFVILKKVYICIKNSKTEIKVNIDADVNVFISFFDIVILLLLIWGGYRGYNKGAIIESLSLFAMLAGMVISIVITKLVYNFFVTKSDVPALFSAIVLGSIFVGAIMFSNFIGLKVKEGIGDVQKGTKNKVIGMIFGVVKYFFMIAIYVVVAYNINDKGQFLPNSERNSKLANGSKFVITKAFPNLKMENIKVTKKDTIEFKNDKVDVNDF
jgi:membrane protein required for colicin V production